MLQGTGYMSLLHDPHACRWNMSMQHMTPRVCPPLDLPVRNLRSSMAVFVSCDD